MVGVEAFWQQVPMNSDVIEYAANAFPDLIAKIPCGNKKNSKEN